MFFCYVHDAAATKNVRNRRLQLDAFAFSQCVWDVSLPDEGYYQTLNERKSQGHLTEKQWEAWICYAGATKTEDFYCIHSE